jgi:GNAT superfamily N-acetyltransferase
MVDVTIAQVDPVLTLPLRQQVLRPKLRLDEMNVFGDDGVDTGTYAAMDETGEVVCTATVRREPPRPGLEDLVPTEDLAKAWRLRGMATRPELRSTGIGSRVLQTCIDHVRADGGGLLWCEARVPAVGFYERAGFVTWGEPFSSHEVDHIVMWRLVAAEEATPATA